MPSGKTHDHITLLLAIPTFLLAYFFTKNIQLAALVTAAMLFGGFMFGPDLDINSRQYQRWGPLRICWWPYKAMFRHRSRLSHGIVLGTVIRIIYFLLVVALIFAAGLYLRELWQGGEPRGPLVLVAAARRVGTLLTAIDRRALLATLAGLWWGAASHTISDLLATTFRQLFKSL